MYSVTWPSTLGEFISSDQWAWTFTYDSNSHWWLVILWALENCDFCVEQSTRGREHRKQKRRLTMGMFFHKRGGVLQYIRKAYGHKERTEYPRTVRKTEGTVSKRLDFSISVYIILLHSYIKAFICSWYLSNTYHSPANVHVNATYCIRSTPVYWSTLRRNCHETDTYLPSSYSRIEYLSRTLSFVTDLVTSLKIEPIRRAMMLCHFGQTRNGYPAS